MPTNTPQDPATSNGDGAAPTASAPVFTDLSSDAKPIESTESAASKPTSDSQETSEPAASSAAAAPAPIPSSYEMPDDYASESLMDKTKEWVENNPALALLSAAGIGLVVGRIVTALIPDPEPETLAKRVEARADELGKDAKKQAKKLAAQAKKRAKKAGEVLSERFDEASDAAEEGFEKSRDLAESVAEAVKVAVAGVAAKKVDEWVSRARK